MNLNILSTLSLLSDAGTPADPAQGAEESLFSSVFAERLADDLAANISKDKNVIAVIDEDDQGAESADPLLDLSAIADQHATLLTPGMIPSLISDQQEMPISVADEVMDHSLTLPAVADDATLQALYAMLQPSVAIAPLQTVSTVPQPGINDDALPVTALLNSDISDDQRTTSQLVSPLTEDTLPGDLKAAILVPSAAVSSPVTAQPAMTPPSAPAPDASRPRVSVTNTAAQTATPLPAGNDSPLPQVSAINDTPLPLAGTLLTPAPQTTSMAANVAPAATLSQLSAPLGTPEWQQALNQQILLFQRDGQHSAELRLHPEELGKLQITLNMNDNQAQLHIAAAHGQVRAAVEAAIPQLRQALAESGIQLGQSSVGGEPTPQWQQGQQNQQASQGGAGSGYARQPSGEETPASVINTPETLQRMASQAAGGVDIFA